MANIIYAVPDRKAIHIAYLLAEEVVPFCGVPEAALSDRGPTYCSINFGSGYVPTAEYHMTTYHPQCDRMVKRLGYILKAMLRLHASQFGSQ